MCTTLQIVKVNPVRSGVARDSHFPSQVDVHRAAQRKPFLKLLEQLSQTFRQSRASMECLIRRHRFNARKVGDSACHAGEEGSEPSPS